MQYYTDLDSYRKTVGAAVTVGKFECLHLGHRKLINTVRDYAMQKGLKSVVFAFDMGGRSLLTNEERKEYLANKIDCLIQCPFTQEMKEMEAEIFIKQVLVKKLAASCIVVGDDFRFGYGAMGDVSLLEKYRSCYGYQLIALAKERYLGREISSTYVREALKKGNVELAARLLGYPYQISGEVEHGRMLGRTFGFPTVNIVPSPQKVMPRFGVYACRVKIDGIWYPAIGNLGVRPTVSNENRLLAEAFLFGYSGNAYGKKASVEFCAFRRPEIKFPSVEKLKKQVREDIAFGIRYFHLRKGSTESGKGE